MYTLEGAASESFTIPDQQQLWDRWHEGHTHASDLVHADRAREQFVLAVSADSPRNVLELGCGQGRDAMWLASAGHVVYGLDHSRVGLSRAASSAMNDGIPLRLLLNDYSEPLPFSEGLFDGVYAHLSLHYFNDQDTQHVLDDIFRVLKPGGVLYFTVRSVADPLHGQGQMLEEDMFCRSGHVRRFFDMEFAERLLAGWDIKSLAPYNMEGDATNPGDFVEGIAHRPNVSERPTSVGAELVEYDEPIPHWDEDPDFFVWDAFARASRFPCGELGRGALQQQALLAHTDNFYVIPDQFGVVSGHVLVLPKEHVASIASVDPDRDEEIVWLLERVSEIVARTYDAQTVTAEHGECGCDTAGQAHIHVLPIPKTVSTEYLAEVMDRVLRRRMVGVDRLTYRGTIFTSPEDLRALCEHPDAKVEGQLLQWDDLHQEGIYPAAARSATGLSRPYVYFKGAGIEFTSMTSFRSQFVREVVSDVVGLPSGSWNRRVFVHRDNMFDTYRQLIAQFGAVGPGQFGFMARAE